MDASRFGRRIAYWRERRGLTQTELGALMGLSLRAIQDIESGARQSDPRFSLIEKAADALHMRVEDLLSDRHLPTVRECIDADELAGLQAAVHQPPQFRPAADVCPGESRDQVVYCWNAFQSAHYSSLGRSLPDLLARVHATGSPDESSMAYQVTSATLIKFGDPVTGMLAADRAIAAARDSGAVVEGSAARRYADALIHLGHGSAAIEALRQAADRLEADLEDAGPAGWSVYGMLLLKSVMAAAERQDGTTVRSLLAQASSIAQRLGSDQNHAFSAFGPTNVRLHEVAAMVALGDGAAAVQAASRIDQVALAVLPRERRAQLLMDLAAGHFLVGRPDSALVVLLAAESLAPQEVHCRASSKKLVGELVSGSRPMPEPRLRALASRCGLIL